VTRMASFGAVSTPLAPRWAVDGILITAQIRSALPGDRGGLVGDMVLRLAVLVDEEAMALEVGGPFRVRLEARVKDLVLRNGLDADVEALEGALGEAFAETINLHLRSQTALEEEIVPLYPRSRA